MSKNKGCRNKPLKDEKEDENKNMEHNQTHLLKGKIISDQQKSVVSCPAMAGYRNIYFSSSTTPTDTTHFGSRLFSLPPPFHMTPPLDLPRKLIL